MGKDDLPGFRHYTPAAAHPLREAARPFTHTLTASRPPAILPAMEWQTTVVPAADIRTGLARAQRRVGRWVSPVLPLPAGAMLIRWASLRGYWSESIVGFLVGSILFGLWWQLIGERLPPAWSAGIRIWTEDNPT